MLQQIGLRSSHILISVLIFCMGIPQVSAYYYSSGGWYIYAIVAFVIIAISSCIGACIRHQRQKQFVARMQQATVVTTTTGTANSGYTSAGGVYPQQPGYPAQTWGIPQDSASGPVQPPQYVPPNEQKDPNAPPAYDEAIAASAMPPVLSGESKPYPTQQYPPQPYPTQQMYPPANAYPPVATDSSASMPQPPMTAPSYSVAPPPEPNQH